MRGLSIVLVTAALFLTLSCQKDLSFQDPSGAVPQQPSDFHAKINGVSWVATTKQANIINGTINIYGLSDNDQAITITLNNVATGDYFLDQFGFGIAAYESNASVGSAPYRSDAGADTSQAGGLVTVTAIDTIRKTISGTFNFRGFREIDTTSKTITDGVFSNIPYTETLPPAAPGDTVKATINGVPWTAQSVTGQGLSGTLFIEGAALDLSRSIALYMPQDIIPGIYSMDANGNYFAEYSPNSSTFHFNDPTGGLITVLDNDPLGQRIRGTFQFTVTDSANLTTTAITNGYFSLHYQ